MVFFIVAYSEDPSFSNIHQTRFKTCLTALHYFAILDRSNEKDNIMGRFLVSIIMSVTLDSFANVAGTSIQIPRWSSLRANRVYPFLLRSDTCSTCNVIHFM